MRDKARGTSMTDLANALTEDVYEKNKDQFNRMLKGVKSSILKFQRSKTV